MNNYELYMQRCIDLATNGAGYVAPNPLVGCVMVHHDKIIGEGFHRKYGEPHAEVNAIQSVKDISSLSECQLYVNLEPCSHYGKTPPCADLIIEKKIPEVIIGTVDPYEEVSGSGIQKLREAGIKVTINVLKEECAELNKRFFTYHLKKRPFIILKWAQTKDGFIAPLHNKNNTIHRISNTYSHQLVHKWRSEEQAIMVGANTALHDNPQLTVRHWTGKNPVRVTIDKNRSLAENLNLFDSSAPTLIFNEDKEEKKENIAYKKIDFSKNILLQVSEKLYQEKINSILIEGGAKLINLFLQENLWDEARIFTSDSFLKEGIPAPELNISPMKSQFIANDQLSIYKNYSFSF